VTAVHLTASWIRSHGRKATAFALFAVVLLTALAVASSSKAAVESPPPPSVWSDKADYAPGELVTLSGANWAPGESVHIRVNDDAGETWRRDVDVTADEAGTIADQFALPTSFIAVYAVTATGAQSGVATWTFTDGNVKFDIAPSTSESQFVETLYSGTTNCTGAIRNNFPKTLDDSNGDSVGVGNSESLRLDASAATTNTPTLSFRAWSTTDGSPFTVIAGTNGLSICIPGFSGNGTRNYRATYGNAAPAIARNNASVTVNEGALAANSGTWSDADTSDTVTLSASVGTVTKSGPNSGGTWSWSFTPSDGPAQSQTVTITANDGTTSSSTTFSLVVNNVAPSATFDAPSPVDEGSNISLSLTSPSDPSSVDTAGFTYAFDCGSGYSAFTGTSSASCSTNDNGSRTVKGKIRDKDGGVSEYTASVTIDNVAPTVSATNDGPIDEGQSATVTASQTDPGADTFEYGFDCDNDGVFSSYGASDSTSCSFGADGDYTVGVKVKDDDGGVGAASAVVNVRNVAPSIDSLSLDPDELDEGDSTDLAATVSDPGSDDTTLDYSIDWGDGSPATEGSTSDGAVAESHAYADDDDDDAYTVTLTVSDSDGDSDSESADVQVHNVVPTVTLDAGNTYTWSESTTAERSFSFSATDPGADTLSITVDCGLGDYVMGSQTATSFRCVFPDGPVADSSEVSVSADDGDGGSDTANAEITINNVAPTVELTGAEHVSEGDMETYSFTVTDPGDDTFNVLNATCDSLGTNGSMVGSPSYTSSGGSFMCYFPDGPMTANVLVRVEDSDHATDADSEKVVVVEIANLPPTVTAPDDQSSNEGEPTSFLLGSFADPGADADWKVDVSWGDATVEPQFIVGSEGNIPAHSHAYPDNGTYMVTVKVTDKDGEFDSETFEVSVANVPPTGTLGNDGPAEEGSSATVDFSDVSDPSSLDNATLHYAFDCAGGSLDAVTYAAAGTFSSTSCTYDDGDSDHTVTGVIIDKDGGRHDASTVVQVNNVAPSATFSNDAPVSEGSSFTLSLTSPTDPSSADATAGFQYRFDCGDGSGYGAYGPSNSATCLTNDSGTRSVKGKIKDKDGGEREYTASVIVNNVAPSATFSHNGPVDEGSSFTISLADPSDPSSVDTAASFQYAFDCGSGYAAYGSAASRSCPTTDNGARAVRGKIKDKDGGEREYTDSVTVNNVAPNVTNVTASNTFAGPLVFMTSSISTFFTDPGSADTWTNLLSFSDGGTESGASPTAQGGDAYKFTLTHSFATPGCKTVMSKVTDDDGGYDTFGPTPVNVGTGQFLPPVTNTPVTNKLKNGQVLPVKVKLTDCNGVPITNLSPAIVLKKGDMTVFNDDSVVAITPGSVSGADTTGVMRSSGDGSYIYNMSVNIALNTDYTILIYPYGTGTPTQYLAHVIQATK
jgi:hypothetical protein